MTTDKPTDPDSLQAIANDLRIIKNEMRGEIAELGGRVMRIDTNLGHPERIEPGAFAGDPPKVHPATGLCSTVDRLAKAEHAARALRTRRSLFTAGTVSALLTIGIELAKTLSASATTPPKPTPPPISAPAVSAGPR